MSINPDNRQNDFERLLASVDPALLEALKEFEISEAEYVRAITGTQDIKIVLGTTSNLEGDQNANLDPNKS